MSYNVKLEELFNQADLDLKDGFYDIAVKNLENIIAEDPDFGKAYNHLGWFYETKFRDYTTAEKYYKQALEKAPNYSAVYTNYSILLSTLQRFDELKALLTRALNVPGIDKPSVFNEFGIMYEQQGLFEMAIGQYKEAIKLTLNNDNLKVYMSSVDRCKTKMNYEI